MPLSPFPFGNLSTPDAGGGGATPVATGTHSISGMSFNVPSVRALTPNETGVEILPNTRYILVMDRTNLVNPSSLRLCGDNVGPPFYDNDYRVTSTDGVSYSSDTLFGGYVRITVTRNPGPGFDDAIQNVITPITFIANPAQSTNTYEGFSGLSVGTIDAGNEFVSAQFAMYRGNSPIASGSFDWALYLASDLGF